MKHEQKNQKGSSTKKLLKHFHFEQIIAKDKSHNSGQQHANIVKSTHHKLSALR